MELLATNGGGILVSCLGKSSVPYPPKPSVSLTFRRPRAYGFVSIRARQMPGGVAAVQAGENAPHPVGSKILEKELTFSPSFADYVKVLEAVKVDRSRQPKPDVGVSSPKRTPGRSLGEAGDSGRRLGSRGKDRDVKDGERGRQVPARTSNWEKVVGHMEEGRGSGGSSSKEAVDVRTWRRTETQGKTWNDSKIDGPSAWRRMENQGKTSMDSKIDGSGAWRMMETQEKTSKDCETDGASSWRRREIQGYTSSNDSKIVGTSAGRRRTQGNTLNDNKIDGVSSWRRMEMQGKTSKDRKIDGTSAWRRETHGNTLNDSKIDSASAWRRMEMQGKTSKNRKIVGTNPWRRETHGNTLNDSKIDGISAWRRMEMQGKTSKDRKIDGTNAWRRETHGNTLNDSKIDGVSAWRRMEMQGKTSKDSKIDGASSWRRGEMQGKISKDSKIDGAGSRRREMQGNTSNDIKIDGTGAWRRETQWNNLNDSKIDGASAWSRREAQRNTLNDNKIDGANAWRRMEMQGKTSNGSKIDSASAWKRMETQGKTSKNSKIDDVSAWRSMKMQGKTSKDTMIDGASAFASDGDALRGKKSDLRPDSTLAEKNSSQRGSSGAAAKEHVENIEKFGGVRIRRGSFFTEAERYFSTTRSSSSTSSSAIVLRREDSDQVLKGNDWRRGVRSGLVTGHQSEKVSVFKSTNLRGGQQRKSTELDDGVVSDDRAAFRSFEVFTDVRNRPRVLRMELEEKIQNLAKWLNATDVNMPEWQFSKIMHSAKIKFTDHSILRVVQILGEFGNWKRVLQVAEWLQFRERFKSYKSKYIYTAVLDALGKARRPMEALNIFYTMRQEKSSYPDLATYHCIACTLGQAGMMKELFDVIDCMKTLPKEKLDLGFDQKWNPRLEPDLVIYNAVLNACVQKKQWEGAFWVLQQLKHQRIKPSSTTYGLVMEVMLVCEKYNLVHEFFHKLNKSYTPNTLSYKVIVNTLWKEGKIDEAVSVVQDMEKRGVVGSASLYYDLARCLCSAGRCQEALMQIDKICKVAKKPLVVTYTGMIQTCVNSGNIKNGEYIFKEMQKFCSPNIITFNIMLKSYLEHGMYEDAKGLFLKVLENSQCINEKADLEGKAIPDQFTFNAMIKAASAARNWDDFEHAFLQMLRHGFHFDKNRHLDMVMDAARAGKGELLDGIWDHLVSVARNLPWPIVKERFCLKLRKGDYASAISCLDIQLDYDPGAFSTESWFKLIKFNAGNKTDNVTRLISEIRNHAAEGHSLRPIIQNLLNACTRFLHVSGTGYSGLRRRTTPSAVAYSDS